MYKTTEQQVDTYKKIHAIINAPVPDVLMQNKDLIKRFRYRDMTYMYSDSGSSYRSGSAEHSELSALFAELIAATQSSADSDLLSMIINSYTRYDLVVGAYVRHPQLTGKPYSFGGQLQFINEVGVDNLERVEADMNALAAELKPVTEDIITRYGDGLMAFTTVPHAVLRQCKVFNEITFYKPYLMAPDITDRLAKVFTVSKMKHHLNTLRAMCLWRSCHPYNNVEGYPSDLVTVAYRAHIRSKTFALLSVEIGGSSYGVIIPPYIDLQAAVM